MHLREWAKRNDLGRMLRACVDDLVVGNGWAPFEGLQHGEPATVAVVYDGTVLRLSESPLKAEVKALQSRNRKLQKELKALKEQLKEKKPVEDNQP